MQVKLTRLFTSLVARSTLLPSFGSSFYTSDKKLLGIFDHGVDPDPSFSGPIFMALERDEASNFCLTLWPLSHEKSPPMRKEILLRGITEVRYQFLAKKGLTPINHSATALNDKWEWRSDWPDSTWEIPACIQIFISQGDHELKFAFAPFSVEPIVTYPTPKKTL